MTLTYFDSAEFVWFDTNTQTRIHFSHSHKHSFLFALILSPPPCSLSMATQNAIAMMSVSRGRKRKHYLMLNPPLLPVGWILHQEVPQPIRLHHIPLTLSNTSSAAFRPAFTPPCLPSTWSLFKLKKLKQSRREQVVHFNQCFKIAPWVALAVRRLGGRQGLYLCPIQPVKRRPGTLRVNDERRSTFLCDR